MQKPKADTLQLLRAAIAHCEEEVASGSGSAHVLNALQQITTAVIGLINNEFKETIKGGGGPWHNLGAWPPGLKTLFARAWDQAKASPEYDKHTWTALDIQIGELARRAHDSAALVNEDGGVECKGVVS
jgi:hypothetical protein